MKTDDQFWFKKQGNLFRPINSTGRWACVFYLIMILMPPVSMLLFEVRINFLVLFLLAGHVTMFTGLFYGVCWLHSK